ncbi:MAG: DHHA1 domain-containing protein, partial [Burkholderiales bacterium]
KALREVLGAHVQQKGSLVDPDKTRFDFVHNEPMTREQMFQVEQIVNKEIMGNMPTLTRLMSIDDAKKTGAMMLFGEKYGDEVRVLNVGSSCELCGGTHVKRTGDIGLFQILEETGVAAGVRRIEARTGDAAIRWAQEGQKELYSVAEKLNCPTSELPNRIEKLLAHVKEQEKELSALKSKLISAGFEKILGEAVDLNGAKLFAMNIPGADAAALRETMDRIKDRVESAVIVLGSVAEGKVVLIAGVTQNLISKIKAEELVNFVAQQVGGKGGGRPDMAQAGGTDPEKLPQSLASVEGWVKAKL